MKHYIKENKVKLQCETIVVLNGKQIINPTEEQLIADGWQVYTPVPVESYKPSYEERVEQLIREKYSINQEFAIQRQRETKADEFAEYFSYCEECKMLAKNEIV